MTVFDKAEPIRGGMAESVRNPTATEFIETIKLAMPIALTQLGQIAMMTTDLALIGRLGDKIEAKQIARAANVPVIPGIDHVTEAEQVRRWMRERGYLFCRRGDVREIMRPVVLPVDPPAWGLCDGIHRDDHEFVPA